MARHVHGLISLLFAAAGLLGGAAALDTSAYVRSQELAAGMKIYWTINAGRIKLALEATATGWVGVGLGETMGMKVRSAPPPSRCSCMCMFEIGSRTWERERMC